MGLLDFITGDNKDGQGNGGNTQDPQAANAQQIDYSQVDTNGSQAMPSYGQPSSVGQGGSTLAGGIPGTASVAPQAQNYSQQATPQSNQSPFGSQTAIPQYNHQPVETNTVPETAVLDSQTQGMPTQTSDPVPTSGAAYATGSIQDPQNNSNIQNNDGTQTDQQINQNTNEDNQETIYGNGELSDIYSNKFPQPQNIDPAQQNVSQPGSVPTPISDPAATATDMSANANSEPAEDPNANNSMANLNSQQDSNQSSQPTNKFKPFNLQDFKIPNIDGLNMSNNQNNSTDKSSEETGTVESDSKPTESNASETQTQDNQNQENTELDSLGMGGSMGSEFGTGTNQVSSDQTGDTTTESQPVPAPTDSQVSIGDEGKQEGSDTASIDSTDSESSDTSPTSIDGESNSDASSENQTNDLQAQAVQNDITDTSLTSENNEENSQDSSNENQPAEETGSMQESSETNETTSVLSSEDSSSGSPSAGADAVETNVGMDSAADSSVHEIENQSVGADQENLVEEIPANKEKFIFSKGVLLGLENISPEYDFTDLINKITDKNIDLILDSKEGGGSKILEQLSNKNKKSTSILLKPLHSTEQTTQVGQQITDDGGVSFVYSNYFEWIRHIAKEARFFVFFEAGGLKNLSLMSVLWNISEMYEGSHKPIFLMGESWGDLLFTIKQKFGISDEDSSTLNVINNVDELLGKLDELNSEYTSGNSNVKMQKVVDRRVEGDEKEFMVYSN